MKIYDVTKIYGIYETQPATRRTDKKSVSLSKTDDLLLSKDAIDFQSVLKGLKEAPDVRAAKVAEFSSKYEAGEHLADTRDIAEALIKSGVLNKNNSN